MLIVPVLAGLAGLCAFTFAHAGARIAAAFPRQH